MPSYELGYFHSKGRAEIARYLFALAQVEYKDTRFDNDTWNKDYKATTPFGQAPFLKVDGQMIADSQAINRYLAKEFGFMGSSTMEEAFINQTIGISEDVFTKLLLIHFVLKTEEEKDEATKKFTDEVLPKFFAYILNNLKPSGFLLGEKISLADVTAFYVLEISRSGEGERTPEKVRGFYKQVSEIQALKTWRANRLTTEY